MQLRPLSVFLILTVWQAAWARHAEPPTPACQSEPGEPAPAAPRPGFTSIGSVAELRRVMASGNQRIRMTPGVYRVTDAAPDNQTVFLVTGSDNHFDLRGVTLQVDTQVLANLRGPVHSLATYRVLGSRITFEGGRFENTGDHPPFQSLSEFVPSGGLVRNCRGNAAYSPLLVIPYKQTRRADIELELLDSPHELGDHPLARITGDAEHRLRIEYTGQQAPEVPRPIVVGSVGDRYTEENTDPKELIRHHIARRVQLENRTPHPVQRTEYAFECNVTSEGPVADGGEDNRVEQIVLIDPPEQGFFSKRLDYEGIPIKAHRDVADEALWAGRQRLEMMLDKVPSVRRRLRAAGAELHIIGRNQVTSDLPDYRHMRGKPFAGKQTVDERTRGFGGRRASCGEENLLKLPEDRYRGRDICVHEFAHTIFDYGTTPEVRRAFEEQSRQSLDRGLWVGAYAATNPGEFFAELSMWYFGTHGDMRMKGPPPGKGPEGLATYDPEAYELFDRFYSGRFETENGGPREE